MSIQDPDANHHQDHGHDRPIATTDPPPVVSSSPRPSPAAAATTASASTAALALWAAIGDGGRSANDNTELIPVVDALSADQQQEYSAAAIGHAVTKTAAWLQHHHGVDCHQVVGVAVGGVSPQLVVVILALFRLRASYLPLASVGSAAAVPPMRSQLVGRESDDPTMLPGYLKDKAQAAGCNWLISLPNSASELDTGLLRVFKLNSTSSAALVGANDKNGHIAYTVHTSGTTNRTNRTRVSVPFASFATHIAEFGHIWPTDPSTTRIALTTPPTFDPHLIELFHAIRWNLPLIVASRLSGAINAGATLLSTTPSRLFLELGRGTIANVLEGKSPITHLYLGGEPFPIARLHALVPMDRWRVEVGNLYGTTENSVWAGCHVLRPEECKELYLTHGVPVSPALMFTEIKVEEERGGAVTIGGERRTCFVNGRPTWYDRTNDAASIIDGHHIIVHGRIDRQIKCHGHRIQLELIESIAHSTPSGDGDGTLTVEHAIAIHDPLTSTLTLAIHPPSFPIDRIWSHFRSACPAHSIPDDIVHIDSVPVTANGKVDSRAVAQLLLSSQRRPIIEPLTAIHQVLAPATTAIDWDPTLSYFTQLGGDSLSAVRVIRLVTCHFDPSTSNSSLDTLQTRLFHSLMHEPIFTFMQMCLQCMPASTATVISKRPRSPSPPSSAPAPLPKRTRTAPALTLARVADLAKCIDAPPLLAALPPDDPSSPHVLVGSHAGQWCAYSMTTRAPLAIHTLPAAPRIEAGMLIHPLRADLVLIGTLAGTLYCCAWRTGEVKHAWDLGKGEPVKCWPVADAEGRVWAGTHAGRVYGGWPMEDGGVDWGEGWELGGAVGARVVFHDGFAYAATTAGNLARIDPNRTSTLDWSAQLAGPIFATPLVIPDTDTLLVCTARSIALVSLTSGAVIRERTPIPHPIFSSPVWIAQWKLVAFGTHGNQVQIMDPESLAVVGVMDFTAPVFANVLVVPEGGGEQERVRMCVAVTDGTLVDLKMEKRQEGDGLVVVSEVARVECRLPGQVFSSPCLVAGGRIVVGCRDNGLYECKLP